MINVNGTKQIAAAISKNPKIKVSHGELSSGLDVEARAHVYGNEELIRTITLYQTDSVIHVSSSSEEDEIIHLIVEVVGNGQIELLGVSSGADIGDEI